MSSSPYFPSALPSSLLECLQSLGHFIYYPNHGNAGDALIATATRQIFSQQNLSYEVYDETKNYAPGYTLVYGGGGWMVPEWVDPSLFTQIFAAPGLGRCIILPHSIRICPELLQLMDERFTVFLREKQSYDYLQSLNLKASIHLVSDMTFYANPEHLPSTGETFRQHPGPSRLRYMWERCVRHILYRMKRPARWQTEHTINQYQLASICRTTLGKALKHSLQTLPDGRRVAWFMRKDKEKSSAIGDARITYDLSSFIVKSWRDALATEQATDLFLWAIDNADIIISDRLHVSVGAAMLNKQIIMVDNNYGKLSGVWQQSMQHMPHVHLCRSNDDITDTYFRLTGQTLHA